MTRHGELCTLGAGPSIIFIRLHNLQIGPVCILDYRCLARVFNHHQVWMFARLSESKLVAGRFACCGSYLGNCCHAISGGRVKLTITIKTPRMMKDFQEIFSFLFLSISSQFPVESDNNNSLGLGLAGAAQARCRWNLTPMNCERRAGPGFAPRQISLIHHL